MAKHKKKRFKQYTGTDATVTRPNITRISAANRSKFIQWWFERKKLLKPIIIFFIVVILVIILITEIVRLASGA